MREFQDLKITINKNDIEEFINYLGQQPGNWQRDFSKEHDVTKFTDGMMFCFNYMLNDEVHSSLWLAEKEKDTLYTSNIVPVMTNRLSISEYNEIQRKFCSELLSKADKKFKLNIELSKETIELEDLVSSEAAQALRSFSRLANKSTGHAHPLDQKRWFEFIKLTAESSYKISPEQLEKFLVEDGWSENSSIELACDYEYSIELLEYLK